MQTYANRKKTPTPQAAQPESVSTSEMLHLSGAGAPQPMSAALREKFEPGFGADFSNIRISRGHIPEAMGIEAVAKGTDILIDSRAGMDVLGHELAHVVQQAQGQVGSGFPVVHNAALEHQADVMGARAASGLSAMESGMGGFGGGEMMSIAPMSAVSAPAQCKSRKQKQEEKDLTTANSVMSINDTVADDTGWKSDNFYAAIDRYNQGQSDPEKQFQMDVGDVRRQRFLSRHMTGTDEENDALFRDVMERGDAAMMPMLSKEARQIMDWDPSKLFSGAQVTGEDMAQNAQYATDSMILSKDTHNLNDLVREGRVTAKDIGFTDEEFETFKKKQVEFASMAGPMASQVTRAKMAQRDSSQKAKDAVGTRGRIGGLLNGRIRAQSKAAPQRGWQGADVSDAAYSKAPRQMAGAHRDPMNRLKEMGWY